MSILWVLCKRFQISPLKLLKKASLADSTENLKAGKSFFAQSWKLVASYYKCIGIFPKKIASAQCWPGSFSSKSKLQLLDNASWWVNNWLILQSKNSINSWMLLYNVTVMCVFVKNGYGISLLWIAKAVIVEPFSEFPFAVPPLNSDCMIYL